MSFRTTQLIGFGLRRYWSTVTSRALSSNSGPWDGYGIRTYIEPAGLVGQGSVARVTLTPVTSGSNLVLAAVWLGHAAAAGDAWDFDGNQVQLLFAGSTGVTLTAGGATVTSDTIPFPLDITRRIIVSFGITSGDMRRGTATNWSMANKAAASGEAGTTNVTGWSSTTSPGILSAIEIMR